MSEDRTQLALTDKMCLDGCASLTSVVVEDEAHEMKLEDAASLHQAIEVEFTLPSGSYATSLLREVCVVRAS